jgi:hypothetical protein
MPMIPGSSRLPPLALHSGQPEAPLRQLQDDRVQGRRALLTQSSAP